MKGFLKRPRETYEYIFTHILFASSFEAKDKFPSNVVL